MRIVSGILGMALLLTCGNQAVWAQAASAAEKSTTESLREAPKGYRVNYTITETEGGRRVGTQHFGFTVNPDSGDSQIKLGSRVPVLTRAYPQDSSAGQADVTYLDVGLRISARLKDFSNGEQIWTEVTQSSLAEEPSTLGKNDPVVRQATLNTTALLNPGKPVMLGSLDIPGSTRHMEVEVVLEALEANAR
jgi:hypothetical protein